MAAERTRVVRIPVAPAMAHRAIFDAMMALTGGRAGVDPYGVIHGEKGVALTSWGEKITAHVSPDGEWCQVQVASRSALPTQVVDWGKHNQNLDQLLRDAAMRLNVRIEDVYRT